MELQFSLEGPDLESGLPLHLLTGALKSVNSIIDKAYLVNCQKVRISSSERELFYIQSHGFRGGSFVADLEIILRHAAPCVALIGTITPNLIWEQAKATFDFLKVIFETARGGTMPAIEEDGGGSVTVIVRDNRFIFNGPVVDIGKAAVPYFRDLAHVLRHDAIEAAKLTPTSQTSAEDPIELHPEDAQLFDVPSTFDSDPVWIRGNIYHFNKFTNQGRVEIESGQSVAAGKYPFKVVGDQEIAEYVNALLRPSIELLGRRETWVDPLGEPAIKILHVLALR